MRFSKIDCDDCRNCHNAKIEVFSRLKSFLNYKNLSEESGAGNFLKPCSNVGNEFLLASIEKRVLISMDFLELLRSIFLNPKTNNQISGVFKMKRLTSLSLTFLLLQSTFCFVLSPTDLSAQTTVAAPVQSPKQPLSFGLQDGTPVKLRTTRNMSSADDKTGATVDFEVLEDVKVGETVVIPRGGVALGTVTRGKPKARMGRGGKLDINIDSVRLVSGEKVALRAVKGTKGRDNTGAMTGAIVATSILFFPAAPFFLFMKGKDITIPKGTEITAYINGDIPLEPSKFVPVQVGQTPPSVGTEQTPNPTAVDSSSVSVKSAPEGAEIMIDGKYAGSTPSTLQIKSGEHTISVKKSGYALWERTMTINARGNITIDAALEKTP